MIRKEIERKLADFRQLGLPPYVPRHGKLHTVPLMVATVIGARRAGKSYRVLQAAAEMVRQKQLPSLDNVCFLDFDNPVLENMRKEELPLIEEVFLQRNPSFDLKTPLVFIFDEIHKIAGWESYVIELSRNRNWKVLVTGSSSKLLRDEVATELRGKAIATELYPLLFKEYLEFLEFRGDTAATKGRAEVHRLFAEYLRWGSFPAIPVTPPGTREALLRDYFSTMVLKDIIQRYNISHPRQCLHVYHYLLSHMGRPCTQCSTYADLKQAGFATSRNAIRDYLAWADDAFLFYTIPVFSDSRKEQSRNVKKLYCTDWALANVNSSVWDGGLSHALENVIYMHLRRHWSRVNYYLTRTHRREIDFIAADSHGKPALAVQVCMDMSVAETAEREIAPLVATAKYFGISEAVVVTMGQENRIRRDGVTIRVCPAPFWLLEDWRE